MGLSIFKGIVHFEINFDMF